MHDPDSVLKSFSLFGKQITLWHVDPCLNGNDDSCGYFKRAHHGSAEVLAKIRSDIEFETTTDVDPGRRMLFTGPTLDPEYSPQGSAMWLLFTAAIHHFGTRKKAIKFVQRNLAEILLFAENPFDSWAETLNGYYRRQYPEEKQRAKEFASSLASTAYGWILRAEERWWQRRCWHVHHWKLQIGAKFIGPMSKRAARQVADPYSSY